MAPRSIVTAFAPATVANVAVGFDVLGFAIEGAGDRVSVSLEKRPGAARITVERIEGLVTDLPREPGRNTASAALEAMVEDLDVGGEFRVSIDKGLPLGSGMGGSAASAVGAVVAADALLGHGVPKSELLRYALEGEAAGSGARHADNAAACLYGGLVAVLSADPPVVTAIPVPPGILCVLVHPKLRVETREARSVLRSEVSLADHARQSARLAGFVSGCHRNDPELIRRSMVDLLIEPQRSSLIPGFERARAVAAEHEALGFSISGSGPSVFAWVTSRERGERLAAALTGVFGGLGIEAESWVSPVDAPGARVES